MTRSRRLLPLRSPGDVIRIFPGTYHETVYIDKDDIVLSGVVIDGAWPVMEGASKLNDAVLYSGNDITVENLQIQHLQRQRHHGPGGQQLPDPQQQHY